MLTPKHPPVSFTLQLETELQGLKRLIVSSGTPLGVGAGGAAAVTPAGAASHLCFDADSGELYQGLSLRIGARRCFSCRCTLLHAPAHLAAHPLTRPAVASDASPVGGAGTKGYVARLLQGSVFGGLRGAAAAGEGAVLEGCFGGAAADKAGSGGAAGFGGDLTNKLVA